MEFRSADHPRRLTDQFFVSDNTSVCYSGFADRVFRWIEAHQLLRTDLWTRFVQQFREEDADRDNGWRGEYWGKMMRGACFIYAYTQNPALYAELERTVTDLLNAQEPDGRISTYARSHEFDGWDLWSRKYVLLGMEYFLEICTDAGLRSRIVASMCRQADYILAHIGSEAEGKKPITAATRNWRGVNSASILEPMMRLYNITGKQAYLDFAAYLVGTGGTDVVDLIDQAYRDQLLPYQYPVTKAYELVSFFEGVLEYSRVTGDLRCRTAVLRYADRILQTDFTIIGCSGCTHELFDHSAVRQANATNGIIMQETCVTVTLMKFFWQLTLLTGNAAYADAFERSFYNAYLGSLNTEQIVDPIILREYPDWKREPLPFDSYSPLTAGTRGNGIGGLKQMSDGHYYGCCACIGSLGMGLVSKMAVVSTGSGLAVNLYLDGRCQITTGTGIPVTLHTHTDYPRSGMIRLALEVSAPTTFSLLLRIPGWSKCSSVAVNGAVQAVDPGYVDLHRQWQTGDTVELELDMTTRVIRPIPYGHQILMNHVVWAADQIVPTYDEQDPDALCRIALQRGPLVLAQEQRLCSMDGPLPIQIEDDDTVSAALTTGRAPFETLVELNVPLTDGTTVTLTDYASAGKTWSEDSRMAAWILIRSPGDR